MRLFDKFDAYILHMCTARLQDGQHVIRPFMLREVFILTKDLEERYLDIQRVLLVSAIVTLLISQTGVIYSGWHPHLWGVAMSLVIAVSGYISTKIAFRAAKRIEEKENDDIFPDFLDLFPRWQLIVYYYTTNLLIFLLIILGYSNYAKSLYSLSVALGIVFILIMANYVVRQHLKKGR